MLTLSENANIARNRQIHPRIKTIFLTNIVNIDAYTCQIVTFSDGVIIEIEMENDNEYYCDVSKNLYIERFLIAPTV